MEFNLKEPIYSQIIEDITTKFINGTYRLGQEIPSRRELAKSLGVNPNTIQRAYREMEDMNLIITARGQGSYMTNDFNLLESLRSKTVEATVGQTVHTLRSLGKTDDEIIRYVSSYLERSEGF